MKVRSERWPAEMGERVGEEGAIKKSNNIT